jgi:hypothetical protein
MAYILRSLAVIGVIALNSPVQSEKPTDGGAIATARRLVKSATQIDADGAAQSLSAAREAAQILAGLDPETRQRLIAMALPAMAGKSDSPARDALTRTR